MVNGALLFFILGLLYFISFCFSLLRTVSLFRHPITWKQTKLFYMWILIQTFLRSLTFGVAMLDVDNNFDVQYLMINVPDSLFISAYLILFWQLVTVYQSTHINSVQSLLQGIAIRRMKVIARVVIITNCAWILIEAMLYGLIFLGLFKSSGKDLEIAIVDVLLAFLVVGISCYLQFRYSGVPFKSRDMRDLLKKTNRVTMVWSIFRLARGGMSVFTQFELKLDMIQGLMDYEDPQHLLASALYIVVLLLSEVLCYFLVLDSGFFGKFLFVPEMESQEVNAGLLSDRVISERSGEMLQSVTSSAFVNSADLEEIMELPSTHRHSLGQVYKAKHRGEVVALRKIRFPRINTYVFEEFLDEVEALKRSDYDHVLPILGGCFDQSTACVVMPFVEAGSLFALLHEQKQKLRKVEKLMIAREVSMGMKELYSEEKHHGHLTSRNILMDSSGPKISDIGLHKLKKFAGVVLGYTNKGPWSSPEQLTARSKSTTKVKESDDVYSFGVVLWELFSEEQPFPGLPLDQLRELVSEQHLRPEIPPDVDVEVSQLIKSCWNTVPDNRPSFSKVHSALCHILSTSVL